MKKYGLKMSVVLALALLGAGCNSSSTPGTCTNCSTITPENFVSALVSLAQSGQIPSAYANTTLAKATSIQPGYFIIWDGETQAYEAVDVDTASDIINSSETGELTESQVCSENGATCSNLNATAAAEAFAGATAKNFKNGDVTGTSFVGSFGQLNFPDPYDTTEEVNEAGGVNYIQVAPDNSASSPSGGQVYQDIYGDGYLYSVGAQTKDVNLQASQAQSATLLQQAATISAGLQMSLNSAVQLTQLAQKIQTLQSTQNQLTSADRAAISSTLLGIAGVSQDEVNQAVSGGVSGDMTQANALLSKISQNLGMPQATLRDQILPKLGVNLN